MYHDDSRQEHDDDRNTVTFFHDKTYWIKYTLCLKIYRTGFDWNYVDYDYVTEGNNTFYKALMKMASCVNFKNEICYRNGKNEKIPVQTKEELYKAAGIGKNVNQRKRFNEWIENHFIVKFRKISVNGGHVKHFVLNPVYYCQNRLYIWTYDLFRNEILNNPFHRLTDFQFRVLEEHLQEEKHAMVKDKGYTNKVADIPDEPAENVLSDSQEEEAPLPTYEETFQHLVMYGNSAAYYNKTDKGMVFAPNDNNKTNLFFAINEFRHTTKNGADYVQRTKENLLHVRNFYCDIDAGKDENGNYFPLEEVSKRKADMKAIIDNVLPTHTAMVETRNGYHVYWTIDEGDIDKVAEWERIEKKLVTLVSVADFAAKDLCRVLRVPDSTHKKAGCEPFAVTLSDATPVSYSMDTFEEILDNTKDKIESACKEYLAKYPETEKPVKGAKKSAKGKKAKTGKKPRVIPLIDNSARLEALKKISAETFKPFAGIWKNLSKKNTLPYLHKINLPKFLEIVNPAAFDCIFHFNPNGDGKSATIYAPEVEVKIDGVTDKSPKWRYVCHCITEQNEPYYDIIDIVMHLANCNFDTAVDYLGFLIGINVTDAKYSKFKRPLKKVA